MNQLPARLAPSHCGAHACAHARAMPGTTCSRAQPQLRTTQPIDGTPAHGGGGAGPSQLTRALGEAVLTERVLLCARTPSSREGRTELRGPSGIYADATRDSRPGRRSQRRTRTHSRRRIRNTEESMSRVGAVCERRLRGDILHDASRGHPSRPHPRARAALASGRRNPHGYLSPSSLHSLVRVVRGARTGAPEAEVYRPSVSGQSF
jgi:hypothetical protein